MALHPRALRRILRLSRLVLALGLAGASLPSAPARAEPVLVESARAAPAPEAPASERSATAPASEGSEGSEAPAPDDRETPPAARLPETVIRARAPLAARRRAPTARAYSVSLRHRVDVDPDLGASLAALPPVGLHRYGGGLTTFSLRGSASHQTRVEVGGFPLTPLGGGSVDLSGLDPALFASAELLAGPQGAAFGAGALGGVLSLSPWSQREKDAPTTELELKGGSYHRADLALRQALGKGLRLSLTARRSQGDFAYQRDLTPNLPDDAWVDERRQNNAHTEGSVLLTGRGRVAGGRLEVLGLTTARRLELPGPMGFPTPGASADTVRSLLGFSFVARGDRPAVPRPQVRAYLRAERIALWPGMSPVPGSGDASTSHLLEAGAVSHADLGLGAHRLDLGLAVEGSSLFGVLEASRIVGALFLTDRVFLLGDRLLLFAGGRLELPSRLGPQGSFSAGALLRLTEALAVQANLGRSVRLPTLVELYRESPLLSPNPELVPESALAADLGLSLELLRARVELELAGFVSRYQNLITYELFPPLKLRASNLRAALIAGLETRLMLRPLPGFTAELGHAFTHSVSLRDDPNERGQTLPYRPAHRGHLRLEGTRGRFAAHLTLEGRSALVRNRAGTKSLPPQALVHLGLRARLLGDCSLGLQLQNLLDDRRQEDVHGYPLPGRAFLTSLRCAFSPKGMSR